MKKLLILAVVATLSFWGCSENSNLTGPTDAQSNQSFLKINTDNVSELSAEAKSFLEFEGVSTLNKSFFPKKVKQLISAEKGGEINFELASKGAIAVGELVIEGGSFDKDTKVKIAMASEEAALDFTPNIDFNDENPALLTVGFIGVDVQVGDIVSFVYIDKNGQEGYVVSDEIIVGNGSVVVVNAQLKHFSRFGFTK